MSTALKAREILAEAQAAAEAEGIFTPTAEQMKALRRLRDLTARKRTIAAEEDAIKKTLISEMESAGAIALAVDGKNLVLIVDKTQDEVFTAEMERAYPEVAAAYLSAKATYEYLLKNFTFRVPATAAKTFPGVR